MKKSIKFLSTVICFTMFSTIASSLPVSASEEISLDKGYIQNLYDYGCFLSEKYSDLFTEESLQFINEGISKAKYIISIENNQGTIDNAVEDIELMFKNAELKKQNKDIVLFDEFYKINKIMQTKGEAYTDFFYTLPEFKDFNGYRLVRASTNMCSPIIYSPIIKGYVFESVNAYYPYNLAVCAVNPESGMIISIEDAMKNDYIDANEVFNYYIENKNSFRFEMALLGDINQDYSLDVKDVTLLQRSIAGIANIEKTVANNYSVNSIDINDYNNDGCISINDVTDIQRKIANIAE